MVQSIIEGPASNIRTVRVYISPQGELLALMTTRTKRQWPVEFGVGTFVETWRNPEFAELGIGFFRDLGFHGVGTVEFKQDERDGQLKVTDVNPRWWGSLQLGRSSGVDFPLIHYLDLTGQQPAPVLDFREGVRWVDARGDAGSAISQVRAGRLSPVDWLRSWAGARSFSTFALDDPRPFLAKYEYGKVLVGGPRHLWRKRRAAS
jgi:predicted ATP-grasp superfamily ATP-dependent carboligase